jgi:3-isopropylmalate dehydratase small subunit
MRVWKFGNDINTDLITPGRYTVTTNKTELGKIAFIEHRPKFAEKVEIGDIIVAGKNFGCGSSREHAPVALKAVGVSAVIARSFARIFFRNAINIGLPLFICEKVNRIKDGDIVEINHKTGQIYDKTQDIVLQAEPLPRFIQKIVEKGGLITFLRSEGYV